MDSKGTTREDHQDSITAHQDSTKEGILHKVQAGGVIQGISTTRSTRVSRPISILAR